MALKIHVIGSSGKLGTQILTLIKNRSDFLPADTVETADVLIDVSSHLACEENINKALKTQKPLIIGTTGHSCENDLLMKQAALLIPLLVAPNFSLGMALCFETALSLTRQLKDECSIEIKEAHHIHKKDSPSGTALALAQTINSDNPPPIHSIREGEIIGEHTVIFRSESETIELKHQALSREAFAKGSLQAAQFLSDKPPRLYSMRDVLYAAC